MIKSLLLLSCAGFLSAGAFNTSTSKLSNGLLTNNKTEYKIETVEPTANWLFKNSSKIGYDSATKDGTNVYQLSTNGTVSLSEKGATIGESGSLYAASFAKDPTYKYSSQGFTFILNFSYETLGWTTSDGVLLQLRFSSADDNYSLFFPKNSNVLKFCSKDERTAGYSTYSDTIGTIDANAQYTLVFTRNNLGETKIYMNGLNGPVFTGSTASASFSSNWTTLSFGSESGSTTGGHSINRFTRHATGLSFSNISFYKGVVDEDGVSQYFATGEVQTKTPIPHQPEPEADYELIANSKLLSRVAYISDSHFRKGLTDPNNYGDSFVYAAINDIKSLNLDFDAVLNLGDLSESGMDRSNISLTNWYDWVDTNPLSNPDNSPVPFYGVLGNHDVRGDSNVSHTALERQEDFLKAAKVYQQREA